MLYPMEDLPDQSGNAEEATEEFGKLIFKCKICGYNEPSDPKS
jgi:hypothetical protein